MREARARHAASLIVYKIENDEPHMLMGMRGAKHRFMPNRLVFPGGRVDIPDLRAPFEVNPNAMLATARAVYAGSLSSGLYVYDRAAGRWSEVRAGLPSANVTALAERGGYIYVGTDNGLVRFRENL